MADYVGDLPYDYYSGDGMGYDYYSYDPSTTILEGGGGIRGSEPSSYGTNYDNSYGLQSVPYSQNYGTYQPSTSKPFTGVYPWESTTQGVSNPPPFYGSTPSYNPSSNPMGPRQLAPQMPSFGPPERTLYDRYSKLLQDPTSMSSDPAYKFMFDQGMQAFNRTAAANRMRLAGKSTLDAQKYGQGLAFNYMNQMLPQYAKGAEEELNRFVAPASIAQRSVGLGQSGTQINNAARSQYDSEMAARDLIPYTQRYMESLMGKPTMPTYGASFGGGDPFSLRLQDVLSGMGYGGNDPYSGAGMLVDPSLDISSYFPDSYDFGLVA